MMRSLHIAKTGLEAQQAKLDATTNNLANLGTRGYKRMSVVAEDNFYQSLRQAGANETAQTQLPTGLQVGTGVHISATTRNFAQGNLDQTGNSLDMGISGQGFFQVQLPDGTQAYTRDGSFQVDANGQLVTNAGYPVSPNISIPANTLSITIGKDGVVSAQLAGATATQQVGQIQLANFVNPAGLDPRGGNLFAETAASGPPQTGNPGANGMGTINQGTLEASNVNVVEELVAMITAQRGHEMMAKAVDKADGMLARLAQL